MGIGEKASAIFFQIQYPKSKVVDSLLIPDETIELKTDGIFANITSQQKQRV